MAFDKDLFRDGESTYDTPYWRQTVEYIDANVDTFSYEEEFKKRRKIQEDEVGIKHPKNDSFIKIKDDGTIEAFAGGASGIRIHPDNRMQIFGDIQLIGNRVHGITPKNQTVFNDISSDIFVEYVKDTFLDIERLIEELELEPFDFEPTWTNGKTNELKGLMRLLGEENIGF